MKQKSNQGTFTSRKIARQRVTVSEGDEDHGAITMTPAVTFGGIDQPVDLGAGQMFPGPIDGVRLTSRRVNCSFYDGWRHQLQR